MSGHDAFERILTSLHEAMLDDVHWPTTTALIDEACGLTSNALLVGEGPNDDLRVLFAGLYYRGQRRETWNESTSRLPSHRRTCAAPAATARPVGPGRAVPGPRERPPPRPEQYGAVPHIDSGILPICPSIVRRRGIPLCTGRGTSAYAVNEESPSPIGPGALQAPGHPRAAAAALLRCWWRGHGPAVLVIGTAAVKTVLPEIPPETLAEWQRAVDLTARLARVPASLIMRTERPKHTVLVSSRTEGNPYDVGREYDLNALLYCQGVFDNDGELVVEDATHDPVWAGNEDLADGMRFYIGYPLKWPSGEVFGTICVLDRERNDHALLFREGCRRSPAWSRRTCGRWSSSPNAGGSKPPCSTRSTRPHGTWSNAPANCRTPTRRCAYGPKTRSWG